jgi:hypothetical protein
MLDLVSFLIHLSVLCIFTSRIKSYTILFGWNQNLSDLPLICVHFLLSCIKNYTISFWLFFVHEKTHGLAIPIFFWVNWSLRLLNVVCQFAGPISQRRIILAKEKLNENPR